MAGCMNSLYMRVCVCVYVCVCVCPINQSTITPVVSVIVSCFQAVGSDLLLDVVGRALFVN